MSLSNGNKTISLTEANLKSLGEEAQELHLNLLDSKTKGADKLVKEPSRLSFFKGPLAEKMDQKKARTTSSVDEYGYAKKVIGLSRFANIELEKTHGDFSKALPNLAYFYSLTAIPKLSDVVASNVIGSKEMSIEEAGRTVISLALKTIQDNHLEPFFKMENRATFPCVPSKDEILEFLTNSHWSHKSLKQMSDLEDSNKKHIESLRLDIDEIDEKIQELEIAEDLEEITMRDRKRLLKLLEAMAGYDTLRLKGIEVPDTTGLTAEEMSVAIDNHQRRLSEASRKREEAQDGFMRQLIKEDIKELGKDKRLLLKDIDEWISKSALSENKKQESIIQLAKEADELHKWHSKAASCFNQVCTMVVGSIKSMVAQYFKENHSSQLKTHMNEMCLETGVSSAYDQGDLLSMILNLERYYASTSFMSGWSELIRFINLRPTNKSSDEDFRIAYDRQCEITIKAVGTESIKFKDLMCVLLLHRSQMGDTEFLQSIQTQQQVLGSKCTFEDLLTELQQMVNDFLTQRLQMISKGRGKPTQQPQNDAQTQEKAQQKKHHQQLKENIAFMAEPGKVGEYFCYENAAGRTCRFGNACLFAHKSDPNILKENKNLCKETARTGTCTRPDTCKQIHTKELFITKKNKEKQPSSSASANDSSAAKTANAAAATSASAPTSRPAPVAKPPAIPQSKSEKANAAYNAEEFEEEFEEEGFEIGFMLDEVDVQLCASAATARKSVKFEDRKGARNQRALWDSGAVRHITNKAVLNPQESDTIIKGIDGKLHATTAVGDYANRKDVLQFDGAAATIFSVSKMVQGGGIVIMDDTRAVLLRGAFAKKLIDEVLTQVPAEESATLQRGMYIDDVYVTDDVSTEIAAPDPPDVPTALGTPDSTAVTATAVHNTTVEATAASEARAIISTGNHRLKIAGGPFAYLNYLVEVGFRPEQIKRLQNNVNAWPAAVTPELVRRYFQKYPITSDEALALIGKSPLHAPLNYLSINRTIPGLIMQLDGFSPDFSKNFTEETFTVHGKRIKPNKVVPSIGGALDAVLIGDVATCALFIRGRKTKKFPHLILIEFAIKWITIWGQLRFICCDMEFITTESLKWCSQYNVLIRASPPSERMHAMATGFIEGMVRHIQDAGQIQMNHVKKNQDLTIVRQIQFWFACCQQAVLLSLLKPSPRDPLKLRYEEVYKEPFNFDTCILMRMATKIIAHSEAPTQHGRGAIFFYMGASPVVQGAVIAISPVTGLTSIKYSFIVEPQDTLPPVSDQQLLKMWPEPVVQNRLTSEEFAPPQFDNYPVAQPLGEVEQPVGWEPIAELQQQVLERELHEPVMTEPETLQRYSLRSSKRALNNAVEEQNVSVLLLDDALLSDAMLVENDLMVLSADAVAFDMQLDGTIPCNEPISKEAKGAPPSVPAANVRRYHPSWQRAQIRECNTLRDIVEPINPGTALPFNATILDMKEVAEVKWKPLPDNELTIQQLNDVSAGALRPEGWLPCVRWVLRGFKDKRQDLVTFAETPDSSYVWWLIGYYVAMGEPVITADLVRAYLNAIEPGTIIVQANRMMQEAGMSKFSRALYNMYGKKDAARVFQDWLNGLLVSTLDWRRMNTGNSCYKLPKFTAADSIPTSAVRHSDDIAAMGPSAQFQLDALKTLAKINPTKPLSTFLGVECVRYNSTTYEPDERGTILSKSVTNKIIDILQETREERLKYNSTGRKRPVALPPNYKTFAKQDHWGEPVDISEYRHLIGLLVFPVKNVRGDLAYAFKYLAGKLGRPVLWDKVCLLWCLDYLENTKEICLLLGGEVKQPTVYMDAAHASEEEARSVLFWYMSLSPDSGFTEARCTITKTSVISSYEAEIMVIGDAIDPILNLEARNHELELPGLALGIDVYGDNRTEINWLNGDVIPNRARHVTTRYYGVRELVETGRFRCHWIDGTENPADLGTKLLSAAMTRKHTAHMLGHRLMKGAKKSFLLQVDI